MDIMIKHKLKAVAPSKYGGIGLAADFMKSIRISACDDQGHEIGYLTATLFKCQELLEDIGQPDYLVTMFDSTKEHARLGSEIYGCAPVEMGEIEFSEGVEALSGQMRRALAQFKVGQFLSGLAAMDLMYITDFKVSAESDQANVGLIVLKGLHRYCRDIEHVFVSPNVFYDGFLDDISRDDGDLIAEALAQRKSSMIRWGNFGFKQLGNGDFMYCLADKMYFGDWSPHTK